MGPDPRRTIETHRNVTQYALHLTQHPCEIDTEPECAKKTAPKCTTCDMFLVESHVNRQLQSRSCLVKHVTRRISHLTRCMQISRKETPRKRPSIWETGSHDEEGVRILRTHTIEMFSERSEYGGHFESPSINTIRWSARNLART